MTHLYTNLPHSGGFGPLHEYRWRRWYGLRPATARPCMRWAGGRQHLRSEGRCDGCCALAERLTILDHGRAWKTSDGRRVVTGEVYGLTLADVLELSMSAARHGLVVEVLPASPWYPGRTTAWCTYSPGPPLARSDIRYDDNGHLTVAGNHLHHFGSRP